MSRVIAVVACGFSLAACSATMPSLSFLKSSPPTQALRIESEPPGADAKTSQGQSCRTPCELTVQTSGADLSVTLALNGYQSQTVPVRQEETTGQDAGGPRLAPNPLYVELAPVAPPAPAKKAPKKKRQPATAAARPAPAAAPPPATAAVPPPAPAAAAEPAASATQYPWPSR
jgi:PEGA domain